MRVLTMEEIAQVGGGDWTDRFNSCMAGNWAADTTKGAIGGAIAGAFFGPGAIIGAIVGAMAGSTSAFGYCAIKSV